MRLWVATAFVIICWLTGSAWALDVTAMGSISNSRELKDAIYTELGPGGDACIRLLNSQGSVGCAAPSARPITGALQPATATTPAANFLPGTVAVLAADQAGAFLQRCVTDPELQQRLAGVLLRHSDVFPGWNPADASPYAAYAVRGAGSEHPWNPRGMGLLRAGFPFPVFQLDNVSSPIALQRAEYNAENQGVTTATNVARMELTMQATGTSSNCVAAQQCYPLGGFSVWASVPPLPPPPAAAPAATLLVVAGVDSAALFHGLTQGADYQLSGLIAVLAAAQIIGAAASDALAAGAPSPYGAKRVAFGALMGEPWDFMGSRRFLWELNSTTAAVEGLDLQTLQGIIEVGQVGRPQREQSSGAAQLYLHTDAGSPSGAGAAPIVAALEAAAATEKEESSSSSSVIAVNPAGSATPGLPPCSSSSFLRVRPDLPTVVIQEFDAAFINEGYQSQFDDARGIDADAIAGAAAVLAHAVHALLGGSALDVNMTKIEETVGALVGCLVEPVPGLACRLVNALMTPVNKGPAPHYVGILRTVTDDPQAPDVNVQSDVERFLWNYLAVATSVGPTGSETADSPAPRCLPSNATQACPAGTVCAGYRDVKGFEGTGVCLNATVRFVPAYSTALDCQGCNGTATFYEYRWNVTDQAKEWERAYGWPEDPMWMESNWPSETPSLVMFLKESSSVDYAVLAAGLAATAAAAVGAVGVNLAWRKRLKRE